jgi:hypothetical protein
MSNTGPILLVAFFVVVSPNLTPAVTAADQAVFTVIHGADPAPVNRKVLYECATQKAVIGVFLFLCRFSERIITFREESTCLTP